MQIFELAFTEPCKTSSSSRHEILPKATLSRPVSVYPVLIRIN